MPQNPWDNVPVVRDRRLNEREQAETRYRNSTGDANPLARPVILPGEEGYAGPGQYLPDAGVVVRKAPWEEVPEVALRPISGRLEAFSAAATEQIPFLDEAAAGVAGLLTGRSYDEVRALQSDVANYDRATYGNERNAGGVAGFGVGLVAPGGAYIAGARGGAQVARAASVGAGYGAVYGAGAGDDTYASRLTGAGVGAATGAAGGAVLQSGAQLATPYATRLASIAGNAVRPAREAAASMGGARPHPAVVASRRMADQLRRRGLSEEQIAAEIATRREAGLNPSLLDIGGENVMATTRAVASAEGPARQVVSEYRNRVASELGPRTVARARQLTPEYQGDAVQGAGEFVRSRRADAVTLYSPAYEQQITVPDVALRALRGDEGTAAMQQARRIASANQDFATMEEIDRLLVADLDAAPVASGRALETIRRGYADLAQAAEGEYAAGLSTRLRQIDNGLDEIPELREARRAYADASAHIDALGGVPDPRTGRQTLGRSSRAPQNVITTPTPQYGTYVEGLPAALPNQVYQRDQIVRQLAQAREGAVGPINALTPGSGAPITQNSAYVAQNLERTFPGQGQRFQQDLGLAREQMTLANRVSPNEGSNTAMRGADSAAEGLGQAANAGMNVATGGTWALARLGIENLVRRGTMNEVEREAFARLAIGPAEEFTRVLRLADQSRANGRPPPREVRAWIIRAQGQLGPQNPVTLQLQQLLLPRPVAAEEEPQ